MALALSPLFALKLPPRIANSPFVGESLKIFHFLREFLHPLFHSKHGDKLEKAALNIFTLQFFLYFIAHAKFDCQTM
jgi:hypothetical protein